MELKISRDNNQRRRQQVSYPIPSYLQRDKVYMNNLRIEQIHELLLCEQSYGGESLTVMNARRMQQPAIKLKEIRAMETDADWSEGPMCRRGSLRKALLKVVVRNIRPTLLVIVEEKKFYCHHLVLRAISGFFRDLKILQMIHLPSPMVTAKSFVSIYRWAIEPCPLMAYDLLMEVFRAAQFLGCDQLVAQCWQMLHKECKRHPDKCIILYINARMKALEMEKYLFQHLGPFFLPLACSLDFLEMNAEMVCRLLHMDTLAVNTEMEVLMAAIMWLNYRWPKREVFLIDILAGVRFELMPFLDLLTLCRRTEGPPALRKAFSIMEIRERILKALDELCCLKDKWRGSCLDKHNSRIWIYDPCCCYHHISACSTVRYLTYNLFVGYMKWLQKHATTHFKRVKPKYQTKILCCPPESSRYFRGN